MAIGGMASLKEFIREQAAALGFDRVGVAAAAPADDFGLFREWLDQGFAGEMEYLRRHAEARRHPESILPEVRSVVMAAFNHCPEQAGPTQPGSGKVARYARGPDYHDLIRARLRELLGCIRGREPAVRGRVVVDTAPLLERDFARRAGLGWIGKNTMLISKRLGSWLFLGALLLDLELEPDPPQQARHCGSCTACLDACPTGALVAPGQLDARRCISYLTIELRGPIPEELRPKLDGWLFGCDVCQEVCPWNRKAPAGTEFPASVELEALDLVEVLGLTEEAFRCRFRATALWRTGRAGLARNAAILLGNLGNQAALPALRGALEDPSPLVREAASWAIHQIEDQGDWARTVGPAG